MGSLFASPAGDGCSQTASTPKEGGHTKDDWEDESSDGQSSGNIKNKSKGSQGSLNSKEGRKRRRAAEAQRIRRAREKMQQAVRDPEESPMPGPSSQPHTTSKPVNQSQAQSQPQPHQLQQREQPQNGARRTLVLRSDTAPPLGLMGPPAPPPQLAGPTRELELSLIHI